ncbi:MAG: hypothetical protein AAF512_07645 [Pseudomonadota bacterium]
MSTVIPAPDVNNTWRLSTPGNDGWIRSARPDAEDKFFMCSADGHVQEPNDFLSARIDKKYHDRLPGVIIAANKKGEEDAKKEMYQKTEGFRPAKINWMKPMEGHEKLRNESGRDPETRVADLALDGCDAEIMFPNKGLTIWATPDPEFSHAMCKAYNEWVWEAYSEYNDRPSGQAGHCIRCTLPIPIHCRLCTSHG